MRGILKVVVALVVMALGFWAYKENYATQSAIKHVRELRRDVSAAHERLAILKDEWAYQNRPARLQDLVELNYQRLALLPMTPDAFGHYNQVVFPPPPGQDFDYNEFTGAVDISTGNMPDEYGDPL